VTPMNLVGQYWRGVQGRLQAEVDGFNSLIWHQGELGRENEPSLAASVVIRGGCCSRLCIGGWVGADEVS